MAEAFRRSAPPNPPELAEFAARLARQAGELAIGMRGATLTVDTKTSSTDVVTNADRAVERFIRDRLAADRPDDAVLGEESGATNSSGSVVRWIVDPIDGTVNYLLGLPHYAVSVAAQVSGRVVAGAVYNPASGALFHASDGGGAFLDGLRLSGPRLIPLSEAVIATGFGYDPAHRARQGAVVGRLLSEVGNLRRMGSAALDLCAVAAGWVDAYYEGPLGEWDYAAGLLIAREAGAATSGLRGRAAGPWFVAAAHPASAADFFGLLTRLGADAAG